MANTPGPATQSVKLDPERLRQRLQSGERFTILDVRGKEPWEQSNEKIRGAIRVDPYNVRVDPSWPKDRPVVAYCT